MSDEPHAWRPLLARHGAALVLFARQFCPTTEDAEDAVQDGFARFWSARQRARDETAYLFACVRAAAIDLSRRQWRLARREQVAVAPSGGFEPDPLVDRERREMLERAVAGLPLEQREVLVLKIWGGLTFAQIAVAQDIPANTAASRYRYALAALRRDLTLLQPSDSSHEQH